MAKRIGALIVFKPGVTKERAAKALASLGDVVEFPKVTPKPTYFMQGKQRCVRYHDEPFKHADALNEYEEEHGSPCFYIP